MHSNGSAVLAESYRTIRTSISHANRSMPKRSILLTSPGAAEGKSTTAANLGIVMARKGMKTLIVDSDLRRPVMDILFMGAHRQVGLTNVLGREIPWNEAVRATTIDGLYLMPAGTNVKNAPEILSSKTMISVVKEIQREFGTVIFDSPPLLPVTDAAILSGLVDGVILVVRSGKATLESIRRSVDLLYKVDACILGAILTGLQDPRGNGYKNYYLSYADNDNPKGKGHAFQSK